MRLLSSFQVQRRQPTLHPSLSLEATAGQGRFRGACYLTFRVFFKSYKSLELKKTLEVIQVVASRLFDFIAYIIPKYLGRQTRLTTFSFAKLRKI